jgi:hypothetical protein
MFLLKPNYCKHFHNVYAEHVSIREQQKSAYV